MLASISVDAPAVPALRAPDFPPIATTIRPVAASSVAPTARARLLPRRRHVVRAAAWMLAAGVGVLFLTSRTDSPDELEVPGAAQATRPVMPYAQPREPIATAGYLAAPVKPVPWSTVDEETTVERSFDMEAAGPILALAADAAADCRSETGERGPMQVEVTFAPSGHSTAPILVSPPFPGSAVGECVALNFRGLIVPPFDGPPVSVTQVVHLR